MCSSPTQAESGTSEHPGCFFVKKMPRYVLAIL